MSNSEIIELRTDMYVFCFFLVFSVIAFSVHGKENSSHFLSFIVPCYNCDQTVEDSIESIFKQRLNCPFELVCTDDGSEDRTYEVLLTIQKKYPEIKIFRHEKNMGGGPCRNTCVRNSQGDLIFCLDSDNLLDGPEDIQQLVDFLDRENLDVACFGVLQFFEENLRLVDQWVYSTSTQTFSIQDLLSTCGNPAFSGNYLYTRKSYDAVGGYSDEYVLDTFYFGFEQVYHGFLIGYLPGFRYLHRLSSNGYYMRGAKAKVLDREFAKILYKHPELFVEDTLNCLLSAVSFGIFPGGVDYQYIVDMKQLRFAFKN